MKMPKTLYPTLALLFVITALAATALAGEGSDTVGACRLMPELRYSYYETPYFTDNLFLWAGWGSRNNYDSWKAKEHGATVQLNWGITDSLDLYGFVGSRIAAEIRGELDIGTANVTNVYDLGTGLTCGIGVKGTFHRWGNGLYVGGGSSLTYSQTDGMRDLRVYAEDTFMFGTMDYGSYFTEKNLAAVADLHAGWHIGDTGLTPYLGVEYRWNKSYVTWREMTSGWSRHYNLSALHPVGVYLGLDYLLNDRLSLNLEGHMVNRWGGSLAVGYKFDLCGKPEPAPVSAPAPVIEPKLEPMSQN
jgi:hypothetical protein